MKQKLLWLLLAALPLSLTGCGNSDTDTVSVPETTETISSDADYGDVTLCDYKNLSVEKKIYEINDEDIDSEIETLLYDYVEYKDQDRPSQEGDYVSVNMTAVSDGTTILDYSDESYDVGLGYEEFGPAFDEKLTGVSTGDELSFSVTYEEDYEDKSLAGTTVDYNVTVLGITEETLPELTDEFITETLGYESEDDMIERITASLQSQYDSDSEYELREDLLQQVIDQSTFGSYSQELYDSCAESIEESYLSYAEMFDCETAEEVYELFGMTDEDVEKEILNQVYRLIAVNEICEIENLTLSDEEYNAGLERYAEESGFESPDGILEAYGEDSLYSWILEDKVLDLLEENATITKVAATTSAEE